MTYAKSHSKQVYYDARKSSWGDLFPHTPKGKEVIRDRGVRRLVPGCSTAEVSNESTEDWPTAELIDETEEPSDEAGSPAREDDSRQRATWSFTQEGLDPGSSSKARGKGVGQRASRRSLHTSAVHRSIHPPPKPAELSELNLNMFKDRDSESETC